MAKHVPQDVYDEHFFIDLSDGGALARQDNRLTPRLKYMFDYADLQPDDTVLDIGCGTGEICFHAARVAKKVVGIDYADEAIRRCRQKAKREPKKVQERLQFVQTDVKHLSAKVKQKFTKVFLLDVVEHLYPGELEKLLRDTRKVMAPNGTLYIHTTPNLDFYRYGYPVIRFFWPVIRHVPACRKIIETKPSWKGRKRLPKDPEEDSYNKIVHVNEQTPRSMRRTLEKCGYETTVLVRPFLRDLSGTSIRIIYGILMVPPLRQMFGADIVAIARKKA